MPDPGPTLTPAQKATLERLLGAGFSFMTFERYARYVGVRKERFVALLDPAEGDIRLFSQAGLLMGEGIGMLVRQGGRQAFVWKEQAVEATPELLEAYERFRQELQSLLSPAR
jgi:hypothetical protein